MEDRIEFRVDRELKRAIQDKDLNVSLICRQALEQATGMTENIEVLMGREETSFAQWADDFIRMYQFVNQKLQDRDNLVLADSKKLLEIWKRIEVRMKTREQLMEEIPELKTLRYEDCFDWVKLIKIIEKYPQSLNGRLGIVQIREGILYREVKNGNFAGLQQARDKLRAEMDLRSQKVGEELQAWTASNEYRRGWLIEMEKLATDKTVEPGARARAQKALEQVPREFLIELAKPDGEKA